jgi:shikimate dehydrogenase
MHTGSARTIQVGLIGAGIQASLSPALHLREAGAHGLPYTYELIDLEALGAEPARAPALLAEAQQRGFAGLNITHPCKQTIIPHLDQLSPDATAIGAVNTVVFENGARVGHNTDWSGFAEAFRRGLPEARLGTVIQIGAGGAGAAITYAALALGVSRLIVFDLQADRAERLAERWSQGIYSGRVSAGRDLAEAVNEADGLIHATPTGMVGHPGLALPAKLLLPRLWVCDVVYFPLHTELLQTASALGCRTLNGGGMAVFQAANAFRLFTGVEPDRERMLTHFISLNGS